MLLKRTPHEKVKLLICSPNSTSAFSATESKITLNKRIEKLMNSNGLLRLKRLLKSSRSILATVYWPASFTHVLGTEFWTSTRIEAHLCFEGIQYFEHLLFIGFGISEHLLFRKRGRVALLPVGHRSSR